MELITMKLVKTSEDILDYRYDIKLPSFISLNEGDMDYCIEVTNQMIKEANDYIDAMVAIKELKFKGE